MKLGGFQLLTDENLDPDVETLKCVLRLDPDVVPPFILVAKRLGQQVIIRIREIG